MFVTFKCLKYFIIITTIIIIITTIITLDKSRGNFSSSTKGGSTAYPPKCTVKKTKKPGNKDHKM